MGRVEGRCYEFGRFRLETAERRLLREGRRVPLTPKAFDTLVLLVENAGHLLEKSDLMGKLWPATFVEEATLARNIADLRKALGEGGNRDHYIETVPKKGYRFSVEVRVISRSDANERVSKRTKLWLMAGLALIVVAAAGYWWWPKSRAAPSIAVLPFRPIPGGVRDEALELGVADTLITRLSGTGQIIVRPTSAVRPYAASGQDSIAAGRALQVDSVLEGSVQRQEGVVRVTARLLRVSDGHAMWASTFDEQSGGLFAIEDAIAERVVTALSVHLSGQAREILAKRYTQNAEAHQLYLKGRYFWNRRTAGGYRTAVDYFRQAIDKDPGYALAYAGLADCYLLMGGYDVAPQKEVIPLASAAARRALEIDSGLAEAHTSLALVAENYEWDWPKAESEYRRALELNPNYATAHHWYGEYIGLMGKFDQGLAELEQAHQLDPLSTIISSDVCKVLYHARRYDQAIQQCRNTLKTEPGFVWAWYWLGSAYWGKGMTDEAVAALEKGDQLLNLPPALAEAVFYRTAAHNRAEALRHVEQSEQGSKQGSPPAWQIGYKYALLGEKDRAFEWLSKGFDERGPWVVGFTTAPSLDLIRADPRYRALLKKLALDGMSHQ